MMDANDYDDGKLRGMEDIKIDSHGTDDVESDHSSVEVPEASPQKNSDEWIQNATAPSPPQTMGNNRHKCKLFLIGFAVAVVLAVCITLPIVLTKDDNKQETQSPKGADAVLTALTGQSRCTKELNICPDGSRVGRDPLNNCEFTPCSGKPAVPVACTMEVRICSDGTTSVGRSGPHCEFEPCPEGFCTTDAKKCPDGSFVSRAIGLNCEFEPCPMIGACTMDVKPCDDGTFVGQDPTNNCAFEDCPSSNVNEIQRIQPKKMHACPLDIKTCPDGTTVSRDPEINCKFPPCRPADVLQFACTLELHICNDGTAVGRTGPNCEFEPCPNHNNVKEETTEQEIFTCTRDIRHCPDGTIVGRVGRKCEFEACPP